MRAGDPARLARVLRAERALARIAAAERATAEAAHAASVADGEAIVAALAGDSPLHGLIVATMAGALRRNAHTTEVLAARAAAAAQAHVVAENRTRILADRTQAAEAAARRDAERRRLEAIGTASTVSGGADKPPAR